jgi:CCR4-NOT transcription complex subunit 2
MNLGADIFNQNDSLNMTAPSPARPRAAVGQAPKKRLSDMTSRERYGLPGLIAKLDPDHPDYSSLAVGVDLSELGLDLARPP